MDLNINLEGIQQQCRICLQKGDVDIWKYKVTLKSEVNENFVMDDATEKSFEQLMEIFFNSENLLDLTEEFPLLCWQCLEDLKYCYIFYDKIKMANLQLKNLYEESLNRCIEEEHLIEVIDERDINEINETNLIETLEEEEKFLNFPPNNIIDETKHLVFLNETSRSENITLDKNDAFVITQFVPEVLEINKHASNHDDDECHPRQNLLTVNLKAVEMKNLENLDDPQVLGSEMTEPAIYICQYCPQAFAKSDYLKTHIQKSHVCKFCTLPFTITEDLFKHIREVHTEHKCAICHKLFSSHTNLRHHMRRVHRINLPAKVTLLDFIKSSNVAENDIEILHEEIETTNVDFRTQYIWKNDDYLKMFTENNTKMN